MRDTPLKSIKNGLGTVAGGPESSREGEEGSSETLRTLNVDPSITQSQPIRNRAISPGSGVPVGREDRWEVAAALQREGGSLREHGEESWCEME